MVTTFIVLRILIFLVVLGWATFFFANEIQKFLDYKNKKRWKNG